MLIRAAAAAALTFVLPGAGQTAFTIGQEAPAAAQPKPDLSTSELAIRELDSERLLTDRDYAAEMLAHIDRIADAADGDAVVPEALESLRLLALVTLERRQEAAEIVHRVLARAPRAAEDYSPSIYAAAAASDHPLLVEVIDTASRNVPGVGWPELRSYLERDLVGPTLWELRDRPALRVRLAEALLRIGWPGPGQGSGDGVRSVLLENRLARGDVTAASEVAAGIASTETLLPLIVQPRYDAAVRPGRDRLEVLREALAAEDRDTAEGLAVSPDEPRLVLLRVHYLRGVGRNSDVLTLLAPFMRDATATAMASEEGMWLINEAAYSLVALGRQEEAIAQLRQVAELPLAEYPYTISGSINFGELLFTVGRTQESLAHATRLQNEAGEFASDYGEMWIASTIVCALSQAGRAAEAAPQLERMRPMSEINPAALTQAYICLGDDAAAAALMVRRLEGDDRGSAILALQDYEMSRGPAQTGARYDRLLALRERPEVRTALERVGRVLRLPLARSYWGNF